MTKVLFDFFASFFGLIIFSPILILIILISFFVEGTPIFFSHERLGKDAIPFRMLKFRTMKPGPSLSAKHDITRLTRWGRFLRKTSIDELPVLFNVFKGEMSLVGPRPLPVKYLDRFNKNQKQRMNVKPGITGLAQIKGRNHLSWEDRFNYDIEYIKKQSLLIDFSIIVKTLFLVLSRKNINSKVQEIMPEFMGTDKNKISNQSINE